MSQDETAIAAALRAAGFNFGALLWRKIQQIWEEEAGDRARASKSLWDALCADTQLKQEAMQAFLDIAAGGAFPSLPKGQIRSAPLRNGDAAGQRNSAEDGQSLPARPSPAECSGEGHATCPPARGPSSRRIRGIAAAHRAAAMVTNKTIGWLGGLYDTDRGKGLCELTYGDLRGTVERYKRHTIGQMNNVVTMAHIAIVARKLIDECDAQGVVPDDVKWVDILPQEVISRFEATWTREKITKEIVRLLSEEEERRVEMLLSVPRLVAEGANA